MFRLPTLAIAFALVASEADAAEVFDGDVLAIAPVGAVAGDGKTPVTVRILARKADGTPWTGLSPRVRASEGRAGSVTERGEGWYAFEFTPPTTTAPVSVELTAEASGEVAKTQVPVRPAGSGSVKVLTNPAELVLGKGDTASVTFRFEGDVLPGDLQLAASSGKLSDLTDMGGGSYTARYTPPSVNYPHLAMIAAVSKSDPDVYGTSVIHLQGSVGFPVDAGAGASVVLRIAGRDYGPVKADASGKASVPIIVSPGINDATKIVVKDGEREESPFDLQIPPTRRLAFVPQLTAVPARQRRAIRVAVHKPDGSPDGGADLRVRAPVGKVGTPRHLGDGIYEVEYTAAEAGEVELTAQIGDASKNQAKLKLKVVRALPDEADWSQLSTLPKGRGEPAHLVVVPKARVVDASGSTKVFVAATDAAGYPIPNVKLKLSASAGSLPATVDTGSSGAAIVAWSAGGSVGAVELGAVFGELESATGLVASRAPVGVAWPRSAGVQGEWEGRLPTDVVEGAQVAAVPEPEPAAPEPVPEPEPRDTASADAEVGKITLDLPDAVAPGSTVTVRATALTSDGKGVPGQTLDFLTNAGTFSEITDSGDGGYVAELSIPKGAEGDLKVSVVADSGVMGRETLRIDPSAISDTTIKRREPKEKADTPMLRVRGGGVLGSYTYAQRPSDDPGPLLPGSLVVGGAEGGRAAPLGGFEADARVWFIDYVGLRAAFRGARYSITAEAFSNDAPDWLYHVRADLTARYPFDVGGEQFWIGAAGGFQMDDFIVFKGCLQPGCTVEYEPLVLPGAEIGLEVGAEVGPAFFVSTLSRGFAFGTVGYRTGVDADVGLELMDNLFVDLGGSFVARRLPIEGETTGLELGELNDTQFVGRLSLGFQY